MNRIVRITHGLRRPLPHVNFVVKYYNSGATRMDDTQIIWDLEDDPQGNVQHIQEHGISMDEVAEVLLNRKNDVIPAETEDRFITFGFTDGGRHLAVVWIDVLDDPRTIFPVTAYDTPAKQRLPRKRKGR